MNRAIASAKLSEVNAGVAECIVAKGACRGYEVNQKSTTRKRYGNFWADFLNGGQPAIHELEDNMQPLSPFQGIDAIR